MPMFIGASIDFSLTYVFSSFRAPIKGRIALRRQYGLNISPATILDLTRRAADAVQSEYETILNRIRKAQVLYVDETSIDVQGKKHWIWAFTTPSETFVVIRQSRGMKKGICLCVSINS